jgi:NtrC-family two-component system sensor histidine kinase KinB
MLLRTKILLGYGIALGLMALAIVWAVLNLVGLGRASDAIVRENYRSILAAENMTGALDRQDSAALLLVLGFDNEALAQFREGEEAFFRWLGRAKDNVTVEGEKETVDGIEDEYSRYRTSMSGLRDLRGEPGRAKAFYRETMLPLFWRVREGCTRLRELNQEAMYGASRRARRVSRTALWSTLAVGAVSAGVGVWFSLLLSKRLVRPIHQVMTATEVLAGGEYDVQVPVAGDDELARLADHFNTMARKLDVYHKLNVGKILAEKQKGEAVLRNIEDGVLVVDGEFHITNMNPPAARILGVDPERADGKHFLEVIRNEALFELIKRAAESGKPPSIEEDRNILTVGEEDRARHYMFAITPVLSTGGELLGVILLLRDVTRLKELDRLKSEFVMKASHELKTPLQSLAMSIDLVEEGAVGRLTDKEKELLSAAREELQRLKSLITDLLDLSRIESGKVAMEFERVSVSTLFERAAGVFKTQAEKQQVELTCSAPGDLPDVRADAGKIAWVLTNLVSNALRYVNPGGHVRLAAERVGDWVHLSVTDDGEGIPEEYQARIFDKFANVKSRRSVGGTGLGLSICKEIVRAHRGTIWVESTPGKGSVFTFTLPVAA